MEQEYSIENAKKYIKQRFMEQGDFLILKEEVFDQMLDRIIALDEEFMEANGVNDGKIYDDDKAFDFLFEEMQKSFEDQKMYCMRFVEDYMDYSEGYLESIGAIEWD
ncbi:MAG: hypothetical protein IJI34_07845 [Clostridia bacterium]|nr:hypothetical protein [Clostridia bacterium]